MKRILVAIIACVYLMASFTLAQATNGDRMAELQTQITDIMQQIYALEEKMEPLQNQASLYELNEVYITMGTIVQTSPQFIVTGGDLSYSSVLGNGTKYYIIENPQDGTSAFGLYTGQHLIGDRISIWVNGYPESATILKPLPAGRIELDNKARALQAQIDELKIRSKQLSAEYHTVYDSCTESLYRYNSDSNTDIVFQLGNPLMVAYGDHRMIESSNFVAAPVAINGTTLIPIRSLMDEVGGKTYWDATTPDTVKVKLGLTSITFQLNNNIADVNGEPVELAVAPQVINGKTVIPLRFVAEHLGMSVEWLQDEQIIRIKNAKGGIETNDNYMKTLGNGKALIFDPTFSVSFEIPESYKVRISQDKVAVHHEIEISKEHVGSIKIWSGGSLYGDRIKPTEEEKSQGIVAIADSGRCYQVKLDNGECLALEIAFVDDGLPPDPDEAAILTRLEELLVTFDEQFAGKLSNYWPTDSRRILSEEEKNCSSEILNEVWSIAPEEATYCWDENYVLYDEWIYETDDPTYGPIKTFFSRVIEEYENNCYDSSWAEKMRGTNRKELEDLVKSIASSISTH